MDLKDEGRGRRGRGRRGRGRGRREEVEEEEEIGKSSEVKDGDQVFHREKTTHIQTTSIEIDSSLLNVYHKHLLVFQWNLMCTRHRLHHPLCHHFHFHFPASHSRQSQEWKESFSDVKVPEVDLHYIWNICLSNLYLHEAV